MIFKLSTTTGVEEEIIDFMPNVVGWGEWKNPEQTVKCEYELNKEGEKIFNEKGEVSVKILESVSLEYADGNKNVHSINLMTGTYHNVNPILIEE